MTDNLLVTLSVIITFSCLVLCSLHLIECKKIKDDYSQLKEELSELKIKGVPNTGASQSEIHWHSFEKSYYVENLNRSFKFFFTLIGIFFSIIISFVGLIGYKWVDNLVTTRISTEKNTMIEIDNRNKREIHEIKEMVSQIYYNQATVNTMQAEALIKVESYDHAIACFTTACYYDLGANAPKNTEQITRNLHNIHALAETKSENLKFKRVLKDNILKILELPIALDKETINFIRLIANELEEKEPSA